MKIDALELRRVALPMVAPFRTSFGVEQERDVLFVRAMTTEAEGWGECVTSRAPHYSSEYSAAAQMTIERFLAPPVLEAPVTAVEVAERLSSVRGHRMAKAAVEMAILDAELRSSGQSLARFLGGVRERVDCGVSVGIEDDIGRLIDVVDRFIGEGYKRIKLKIEPGRDIEPVRAIRDKFGDDLLLQVDANAAYTLADARHLARLDEFDLLLIEQPLSEEDIGGHVELARTVKTPICLDESITSAGVAADAIGRGACSIINIKAGRVGGYIEARKIHDLCAAHGVPVWCGGMLESGLGRAANVALASLPNFLLPGDTSASNRYYATDLTQPFVLEDGQLRVPTGPGLGVEPLPDVLEEITREVKTIRP
jgi:o-succinylbenzoate synthase